jgi:hypothetical protein
MDVRQAIYVAMRVSATKLPAIAEPSLKSRKDRSFCAKGAYIHASVVAEFFGSMQNRGGVSHEV